MHLKSSQRDLCMLAPGSSVPRHEGEGAALLPHWAVDGGQAGCPPVSPDLPVWQPAASARGSTHPGMGTPHLPALPMGEMASTKERENNKRLDPASQIIHGDISSSPFVYLIEKLIGSF